MSEVLGLRVDSLTLEEALTRIEQWSDEGRPRQVVTLNPEMVMRASEDAGFRAILAQADLVTADGVGILWAVNRLGDRLPGTVSGIDLVEGLLRRGAARGTRLYFCGGRPGVAAAARERAQARFPGVEIVGAQHGYFGKTEEETVADSIRESDPDVVLVALGSPRQEEFIRRHLSRFGRGVAIGVGGSLDVLAGTTKRAPLWIRRARLEWLYRVLLQPKRWGRALALPRFAWRVITTGKRGGVA